MFLMGLGPGFVLHLGRGGFGGPNFGAPQQHYRGGEHGGPMNFTNLSEIGNLLLGILPVFLMVGMGSFPILMTILGFVGTAVFNSTHLSQDSTRILAVLLAIFMFVSLISKSLDYHEEITRNGRTPFYRTPPSRNNRNAANVPNEHALAEGTEVIVIGVVGIAAVFAVYWPQMYRFAMQSLPRSLAIRFHRMFSNTIFVPAEIPLGGVPTSKSALESLEEITLEERHFIVAGGPVLSCAICLESYRLNESGIVRLPCSHLFHKSCVLPWLRKHNSCPTCRNELPTDNPVYEQERMARENLRFATRSRRGEPTVPVGENQQRESQRGYVEAATPATQRQSNGTNRVRQRSFMRNLRSGMIRVARILGGGATAVVRDEDDQAAAARDSEQRAGDASRHASPSRRTWRRSSGSTERTSSRSRTTENAEGESASNTGGIGGLFNQFLPSILRRRTNSNVGDGNTSDAKSLLIGLSVHRLKQVARLHHVDVSRCLEKEELVAELARSIPASQLTTLT